MKKFLALFLLSTQFPSASASFCAVHLQEAIEVSSSTFFEKAEALNLELDRILDLKGVPSQKKKEITKRTGDIFFHAVQNTVQHGSRELQDPSYQGEGHATAETKIFEQGGDLYVQVSNPKIKSFPDALNKTFHQGEFPMIPSRQRVGFRGHTIGYFSIFQDLEKLPTGTTVGWSVVDNRVVFTLKLPGKGLKD